MSDDTIRIFISSPGDVGQERVIAERVIERLQGEFAGRATLKPVRWEREPLRATEHFQEQITAPAETDVALFILWSRLGTPLPEDKFQKESGEPYRSGTEWEFENAVEGYRETGTPDLLTYRKTKDPEATLSDEDDVQRRLEQKQALEAFIDRWFKGEEGESFQAAFHTFETPAEFERRLEEHLRRLVEEKLPERYTETGQAAPLADVQWHRGSPFRGLRAFEAEHAPIFFGRTEATGEIIDALETKAEAGAPFVLVTGPSGSGKSSVVKAGVVPTLTRPGVIENVGLWRRGRMRPSDAPSDLLAGLARALLAEEALPQIEDLGFDANELAELLREAPAQASGPIERALEATAESFAEEKGLPEPPAARCLLVLDQMEELFTLGDATDEERAAFVAALQALAESGQVWIVATMRSDFFPRCTELPALMDLKTGAGHYDLEPPSFAALGYMIRGPVRAAGLQFERDPDRELGLDEVLHEAAAEAPEALPLLEFTLEELYRRRTEDDVLTFDAYEELGGLTGAIAERAESVFGDLDPDVQAAFNDVMRGLVTIEPGENESATSRRADMTELTDTPEKEALTDALVDARLLVTGRTDAGAAVVSVAHEALLREWPRLRDWIERNRAFLRTRARVQERASRWDAEGRPDDLLLPTGQPLAEGRGLLEEREDALGDTLRTYIERSIERAEQQQRRRRRLIGGAVAAFVLVVAGFGLFSYQQWTAAAEQRDQVLQSQSRSLAEEAYRQVEQGDAMTAMLLGLEALPNDVSDPDRPYVPQAQAALYHAHAHNREKALFDPHTAPITKANFGPKGRFLVTAAEDSTTRLYDLRRREVLGPLGDPHPASIAGVSFDSSGRRVALAAGKTVSVWSVPSREKIAGLTFRDSVGDLALSPGGKRILAAAGRADENDADSMTLHERTVDGERMGRADIRGQDVQVGYSPSGTYRRAMSIILGPMGRRPQKTRTYLWADGLDGAPASSSLRNVFVGNITFTPDERQLVLGGIKQPSPDNPRLTSLIQRLAVPGLSKQQRITESGSILRSLSPTGRFGGVQSPENDTLRLINASSGKTLARLLSGTTVSPRQVAFGPDDRQLAVAQGNGTVRVWSVPGGEERATYRARVSGPLGVDIRPSEQRVVVVGKEGVQAWTTRKSTGVRLLGGEEAADRNPVLSPAGRYAAYVDTAGAATLHGLVSDGEDKMLEEREADVVDIEFGPDGRTVATSEEDGTVRLWSVETGVQRARFDHSARVVEVSFAGDGHRIVALVDSAQGSSQQGETLQRAVIWNTEAQEKLAEVDSVDGDLFSIVDVTPDRSRILITRDPRLSPTERQMGRPKSDSVLVDVRSAATGEREALFGQEQRIERLFGLPGEGATISPDGTYALAQRESSVAALNLENGRTFALHELQDETSAYAPAFSPNGKRVALLKGNPNERPEAYVIDVRTQERQARLQFSEWGRRDVPKSLQFSSAGHRLATEVRSTRSNRTQTVVWHLPPDRTAPLDTLALPTHGRTIGPSLQYSADGSYLLTAGEKEVRLYGAEPQEEETYLQEVMDMHHSGAIDWAKMTPDTRHVVTRTESGTVRAWPIYEVQALIDSARVAVTRELTDAQREQFNLTP